MSDDELVTNEKCSLIELLHAKASKVFDDAVSHQKHRDKIREILRTLGQFLQIMLITQTKYAFSQGHEDLYLYYEKKINSIYIGIVAVTEKLNSKYKKEVSKSERFKRRLSVKRIDSRGTTSKAIKETEKQIKNDIKKNNTIAERRSTVTTPAEKGKTNYHSSGINKEDLDGQYEECNEEPGECEEEIDEKRLIEEAMQDAETMEDILAETEELADESSIFEHIFPITCNICNQLKTYECLVKHHDPTKCIVARKYYGPCSSGDYLIIRAKSPRRKRRDKKNIKMKNGDKKKSENDLDESNKKVVKSKSKKFAKKISDTKLNISSSSSVSTESSEEEDSKKKASSEIETVTTTRLNCFTTSLNMDNVKFLNTTRRGLIVHLLELDEANNDNLAEACKKSEHPYRRDVSITPKGLIIHEVERVRGGEMKNSTKKYVNDIQKAKLVNQTTTNSIVMKTHEFKDETGNQVLIHETEPNLNTILKSAIKFTDKDFQLVMDTFIVLRHVKVVNTDKNTNKKTGTQFFEPVFVKMSRTNSKTESQPKIDPSIDYRMRMFYYTTDKDGKSILSGLLVRPKELINICQQCVEERCNKAISNNTPIMDVRDRQISIKVRLNSEDKLDFMKEYQTFMKNKYRVVLQKLIVEGESAYIRFRTDPVFTKVSAKEKEQATKEVKVIDTSNKEAEVNMVSCKLDSIEHKGILSEIKLTRNESNKIVKEEITTPNIHIILKEMLRQKDIHSKDKTGTTVSADDDHACTSQVVRFYIITDLMYFTKNSETNMLETTSEVRSILVQCQKFKHLSAKDSVVDVKPKTDAQKKKYADFFGFYKLGPFIKTTNSQGEEESIRLILNGNVQASDVFHQKASNMIKQKDKEIIKFVTFSPTSALGLTSEMELKCGITSHLDAVISHKKFRLLFNDEEANTFSRSSCPKPMEDCISHCVLCSSIETTHLNRIYTNTIRVNEEYALRVIVEEPNIFTIICKRASDANDKASLEILNMKKIYHNEDTLKKYFGANGALGENEKTKKDSKSSKENKERKSSGDGNLKQHKDTCPYRIYGRFTILSKRTYQKITLDENQEEVAENIWIVYEPKIVNSICTECQKANIALQSHDGAIDCANFSLPSQIISVYDVLIALSCLMMETVDARDEDRQKITYAKYKQRVQRFMNPLH